MPEQNAEAPEPVKERADRLLQESTAKKLLTAEDIDDAKNFGSMSSPAKVELYAKLLFRQLTGERDRLLVEKNSLSEECVGLRAKDKELESLKKSLARDRWEMAIAVLAMAAGGGLIGSYPSGSVYFGVGWTLIAGAGIWQFGKTIWVTIVDHLTR